MTDKLVERLEAEIEALTEDIGSALNSVTLETEARVAAEQQLAEARAREERKDAAITFVEDLLGAYEGSEKRTGSFRENVVWINAHSDEGDFQQMLSALREALAPTDETEREPAECDESCEDPDCPYTH